MPFMLKSILFKYYIYIDGSTVNDELYRIKPVMKTSKINKETMRNKYVTINTQLPRRE